MSRDCAGQPQPDGPADAPPLPMIDPDAAQREYDAVEAERLARIVAERLPDPPAEGGAQ